MEKEKSDFLEIDIDTTKDFELKLDGGLMEYIKTSGTTTTYKGLKEEDLIKFFKGSTYSSYYIGVDPYDTEEVKLPDPIIPVEKSTEYPVSRLINEKLLKK